MNRTPLSVAASAAALFLAANSAALAHVVCGNRVFPATLIMDDPGVGNELSLPTIQYTPIPPSNGSASGHDVDYGYEWDKTITRDLGFAINGDFFTQRGAGQDLNGWNNITLTLKDELPCIEDHELAWSVGVVRELTGTGSAHLVAAGAIDTISSTSPTFYIGKGLGDLPIGFFRPFAITGELSYAFSDKPQFSPNEWDYAVSLQYSIPYLQQHVKALNIPAFMGRLIPLVEIAYAAPAHGTPTGTIAPGFLYEGNTWQVGIEAVIPANAATRLSQGTGFIVQFHLFLDDLLWNTPLGKPLIDKDLWQW